MRKFLSMIILGLAVFCSVLLAPHFTTGEWNDVPAYVEEMGFAHGSNGHSLFIIVRLGNGEKIRVSPDKDQYVKRGDKVILRSYDRLLGGKKYIFLEKGD